MKRKLFAVCMVLALMLTCLFAIPAQAAVAFPVAQGDRTVLNGDFSEGGEGWVIPAEGKGGIMEEGGNKFARMTAITDLVSPSINVTSGETITWEFDYRSFETTSNTLGWRFSVFYITEDGKESAGSPPHHVSYMDIQPNWKHASYACKVPNGMVRASFRINCYSMNSEAYIDIDNVIAVWTPTVDEAIYNGDMEAVQDNMPKGYTASGDNVTIERVMTHSGKTAIKITNSTDTTSYVSTNVYTRSSGNYDVPPTDFSAWMNLTEFEDDPADSEDGVRLEVYQGTALKNNSGWFVKTKEADDLPVGWRKMMICWDWCRVTGLMELRVTLNGKGTVYVDDFYTEAAKDLIRNGDFEGFEKEGTPAYWTTTMTWGNQIEIIREPETGNHYLKLTNASTGAGATQTQNQLTDMVVGNRYKFTVDIKGNNGDAAVIVPDMAFNAGFGIGCTGNGGKDWFEDFTLYFQARKQNDQFSLIDRFGGATADVYPAFDNVKVEPVVCETAFYDAGGNKVTKAENGKAYTAKYIGYGKNYSSTTESAPVSLIYALYEKLEGGSVRLASVTLEKGTAKYVPVKTSPSDKYVLTKEDAVQGYIPLELNASAITIPNDGKTYELRAYTWDDFTNMAPYYASISA